ncbi:hypothetical protein [Chryseolinea soli]|uniref:hypothetical protein n=1 Tax=Chryseolinea soli TaxID=2321403 RepID=UPI00135C61B0|nr:hypothetical protein [Chryseolinea soli]
MKTKEEVSEMRLLLLSRKYLDPTCFFIWTLGFRNPDNGGIDRLNFSVSSLKQQAMLTEHEREELSGQMASVRSKMNLICDLLHVELMETSILSSIDAKREREQALVIKVRDLRKAIEYYVMNHKIYPINRRIDANKSDPIS